MKILLSTSIFFFCINIWATDLYVTTTGAGTACTSGTPCSWSYAMSIANGGDIIYVKAGNYGNISLTTNLAGTNGNPIKVIGYKTTINDIVASNGPTFTYANYQSNSNQLDATEMPLIQGSRTNDKAVNQSYGIYVQDAYWEFHNIAVIYKDYGILVGTAFAPTLATNTLINNLACAWMGNFDPNDSWNPTAPSANSSYTPTLPAGGTATNFVNLQGQAVAAYADNTTVTNSICINGGARGFQFAWCDNPVANYVEVYSDQNVNPTDYYLNFYDSQNPTASNITVKRLGHLTHQGHGVSLKNNVNGGTFSNLELFNCDLELNIDCDNNTFTDFTVTGATTEYATNGKRGGIILSSGSDDNEFHNGRVLNTEGIRFWDAKEPEGVGSTVNAAGDRNIFNNILVHNSSYANLAPIAYNWILQANRLTAGADDNKYYNCTFDGSSNLYRVDRANIGTNFYNCLFSNISGLRSSYCTTTTGVCTEGSNTGIALNSTYNSSYSYNMGTTLSGNTISTTPDFTDYANDDFSYGASSDLDGISAVNTYRAAGGDVGYVDNTASPPADTTAPIVSNVQFSNIFSNKFDVTWDLDEPSWGWVEYGTSTGVYPYETAHQEDFTYSSHNFRIGGTNGNPFLEQGTTYYMRFKVKDAAGNEGWSSEYTQATTSPESIMSLSSGSFYSGWKLTNGKVYLAN